MSPRPNQQLPLFIILVLMSIAIPASLESAAAPEPERAEYAVRWNIQDGGPKLAEQVLAILKRTPANSEQYNVEYFDLPSAASTPDDFLLILRRQVTSSGRSGLTLKYRGDHPLASWVCPLPKPYRTKTEIDISFTDTDVVNRAYSYSCTAYVTEPPAELHALLKGCASVMTRMANDGLTVEEWHLPGDITLIDVSRQGPNTKEALAGFRNQVVEKLIQSGIHPIARSKTELGSRCDTTSG